MLKEKTFSRIFKIVPFSECLSSVTIFGTLFLAARKLQLSEKVVYRKTGFSKWWQGEQYMLFRIFGPTHHSVLVRQIRRPLRGYHYTHIVIYIYGVRCMFLVQMVMGCIVTLK